MGNLGKIKLWAKVGGPMPNMDFTTEERIHDLPASDAHRSFMNRADGDPSYIEFIEDPMSGGSMVIPQRRSQQIANYIDGVSSSTDLASPRIVWNVLTKTKDDDDISSCVGNETYLTKLITNTKQEILAPNSYTSEYSGPIWSNPRMPIIRTPPDETDQDPIEEDKNKPKTADDFTTAAIAQERSCQDVWWSVQTTSMSSDTTSCVPFYIDVSFQTPCVSKQPTFLILRIGDISSSKSNADENAEIIDLVFIDGQSAMMYDRGAMTEKTIKSGTTEKKSKVPSSITLSNSIAWDTQIHRIGILPIAGRLCISVDGKDTLYTRMAVSTPESTAKEDSGEAVDETDNKNPALTKGTILFFPSYSKIRLIGSNSIAVVSLSATVFPKVASLPTSMPGGFNEKTNSSDVPLKGSKDGLADGDISSMVELPNQDDKPILGAFSKTCDGFTLDGGDEWGILAKDKMYGALNLVLEKDKNGTPSKSIPIGKHYSIHFESESGNFGESSSENDTKYVNGFPIFFRARGGTKVENVPPQQTAAIEIGFAIMELIESFTSPDRYHVTHSVDITLYNENGLFDRLIEKSSPIQLGYSWSTELAGGEPTEEVKNTIFTGVTLNGSKTMVAGKETLTIHCEDYMFILGATQVINSPFFDGMDGFNVVKSLASKAHVICVDDTGGKTGDRFFMPSGYSFLEPVKRYDGKSLVKDCILDVCSMAPKVVYFDGDGLLHYSSIQGGIGFTEAKDAVPVVKYYSDPTIATDKNLILEQKQLEVKLNSVVNNIYCRTVDRATRTIVMMNDKAETTEDILCYKKIIYILIPSLGSYKALTNFIERLKPIAYKPIRAVTIKVADDTPIFPMNYMEVDNKKYRIMGLNRSIIIEDNSITTSITGEWMGYHGSKIPT
jgi:hypothetical protein